MSSSFGADVGGVKAYHGTAARLVVGEPTASEPIAGKPGHQALVYGDEGWVFRVDDRGYLYEHVER